VALMLSSQTKDTVNAEAMRRLQTELPACAPGKPVGLNLENMLAVDEKVLNELIGKVGFHNNKTKYVCFHFSFTYLLSFSLPYLPLPWPVQVPDVKRTY
jgi:endonuclease III